MRGCNLSNKMRINIFLCRNNFCNSNNGDNHSFFTSLVMQLGSFIRENKNMLFLKNSLGVFPLVIEINQIS